MKSLKSMKAQKGNVLFLILIAVALFAALSYAVTQSSRSGSDASRETNVINTSTLTQYPNQVRAAVLRLVISGTDPAQLQFNNPDEQTGAGFTAFTPTRAIFHATGGAAAWSQVPARFHVSATTDQSWIYSMAFMVPGLGSDSTNGVGNELIAFADDLSQQICSRLNNDLGWGAEIPVTASAITLSSTTRTPLYRIATTTGPVAPTVTGTLPATTPADWFKNKAFGCFQNAAAGPYVFYYTLVER